MNFYLSILLILIIIVIITIIFFSFKLCSIVVYPKKKTYEDGYIAQIKALNLEEYYNSLTKREITIKSNYGYDLKGIFIPNEKNKKCIIICHGITANINYSVKYIKPFFDRGYSIFLYDHRNHGYSGGTYTSMGFYEKYDLKSCTNWVINNLGENVIIGVFGESMGAGTVLQYCGIDDRISFCIEDCGYSDVKELFAFRMKEDYKVNSSLILNCANLIMKLKYKWDFKNTSPINVVKTLTLPVLFIHGDSDTYVPTYMVYNMYNSKVSGIKDLYIAPNAAHAKAYISNPKKYHEVINNFLDKIQL